MLDGKAEPLKLVFTSYRDSIGMVDGLKLSLDRHAPRACSYPALPYLVMPATRNLNSVNTERVCNAVLDNNWGLVWDFIDRMYGLGLRQLVLCCWCTKEKIAYGKFCSAGIIGKYIQDKIDMEKAFEFPMEVEYRDGRGIL